MELNERMVLLDGDDRRFIIFALDEFMARPEMPKHVFDRLVETRQKMGRA